MKTKLSINAICVLALSAVSLGLVPSAASAYTGGGYANQSQNVYATQLPPHLKALNLSQEQKEKLQSVQLAHQQVLNTSLDQMRINKAAERDLVESPSFDEKKAEKLAAEDAKIMEANTLATLRFRHEIYQILTPEQRVKFKELKTEHHKSRQAQMAPRSAQ